MHKYSSRMTYTYLHLQNGEYVSLSIQSMAKLQTSWMSGLPNDKKG